MTEPKPKKLFDDQGYDEPESKRSMLPLVVLVIVFLAGVGVVIAVQQLTKEPPQYKLVDLRKRIEEVNSQPDVNTTLILPGIRRPPAFSPDKVKIRNSAQVVGVVVGNRKRAYVVNAMRAYGQRVINDLIDYTPVTVMYDPQKEVVRILTSKVLDQPLEFGLGGYTDANMFVQLKNAQFPIEGKMPFPDMEFERVPWGEWKELHPDTDIFTGDGIILPHSREDELQRKREAEELKAYREKLKKMGTDKTGTDKTGSSAKTKSESKPTPSKGPTPKAPTPKAKSTEAKSAK